MKLVDLVLLVLVACALVFLFWQLIELTRISNVAGQCNLQSLRGICILSGWAPGRTRSTVHAHEEPVASPFGPRAAAQGPGAQKQKNGP